MIPIISLPNKIRVRVTMKSLQNCIQTDGTGTPTCTISDMKLRVFGVHLEQAMQAVIDNQIKKGGGYAVKIVSFEEHVNEPFVATDPTVSDQTWTLNIRNIKVQN